MEKTAGAHILKAGVEEYPYQRIFERDEFTCQYCGWGARKSFEAWFVANLSVDHIKPRKHNGSDDDDNLVTSCHSCNLYKGSVYCENIEQARKIVAEKRAQAKQWYQRYVVKEI